MKTYTCKSFTGHYPVGSAAVVSADSPEAAAELLNTALRNAGLPGDARVADLIPFPIDPENVRVLVDGDY